MILDIVVDKRDATKYFWAQYYLQSKTTLFDAAYELAVGQSIGNPNARSKWETAEMVENHCAKIYRVFEVDGSSAGGDITINRDRRGYVWIGFPYANIDFFQDGVSQLLCMVMGGQLDIDNIEKCQLVDLIVDQSRTDMFPPRFGITGFRELVGQYNKPLFGGIVKPKSGLTPTQLLDLVKELLDGGVDFIKEDEILGSPDVCSFDKRVELISDFWIENNPKTVYTFCINGDPFSVMEKCSMVAGYDVPKLGVHANIWSGLGVYADIRSQDIFQHYQKSGDKILTNSRHDFHIKWKVLCKLAALCGVDTIHAGMIGGYYTASDEVDVIEAVRILQAANVTPALSCGLTADSVKPITEKIGIDWLANSGGAIHSHNDGTAAGAREIRKAIDSLAV